MMRKKKSRFIFIFFLIVLLCVIAYLFILFQQSNRVISPLPDESEKKNTIFIPFVNKKNPDTLKKKILEKTTPYWNDYSISIINLQSDFSLKISDEEMFEAASVNKISILATLYALVQKEEIDLEESITLQQADVQDYGTGSLRYVTPGTVYTIKSLAKIMMSQSDNTAAYILANHIIGIEKMQSILTSWGLIQTNIIENTTSNADMYILLKKMYSGSIVNEALTKEMLSFMKDSDFEDRIPALLPPDVTVYHKIGNGIGLLHDVGIVIGPTTKYYCGIFVSGYTNETETIQRIAEISKLIYEYMK